MTSCTIIVSHYNSLPFLRACVRSIKKNEHPEIITKIIVADQSDIPEHEEVVKEYWYDDEVHIVWMKPLYSGFGLDYIFRNRNIETEYICQLHVDVVVIHPNWLYLPIKLIEENNLSFVGQLHFISKETDTIYPPNNPFFSMSPTFNVARKETYEEMSMEAGFTRFHNRPESGLEFKNNDWALWAAADYNARGSDDDTVAFHWEDKYREHDKLGLLTTSFTKSNFGRIIEDIVFHFCSCRESIGVEEHMGDQYNMYYKKIKENYSDELVEELISLSKQNPINADYHSILARNFWDGKLKQSFPPTEALNKRIEELKNI